MGKSEMKKYLLNGFAVFIFAFFISFLNTGQASAFGETFRWIGRDAIEMSGGSFNDMLVDGPNQSRPLRFTGSPDNIAIGDSAIYQSSRPLTINTNAGTCRMHLEIALQTTEINGQAWVLPANGTLRDTGTFTQSDRDDGHESCIAWASGDGPTSGRAAAARAMNAFWNQNCFNNDPGWGENEYSSCNSSFNRSDAFPGKTVGIANPAAMYPALASQCTSADDAAAWNDCVEQMLRTQAGSDEGIETGEAAPDEEAADAADANVCSGGGLGWITCPFVALLAGAIEGIANVMDMLLFVEPLDLSTSSPMYQLWSIFRNIANVAFIMVFLLVIFSQITSMGLSNYGIKSILPRLVIAVILVNISYFICAIAIDAFNILGSGIEGIMQAGINAVPDPQSNSELGIDWSRGWGVAMSGLVALLIIGGAAAGAVAAVLLGAQVIPIIISALLAVMLPILIAFAIIVIRHVFIILLVLLSPLAFVSMLLPGTSNLFSKWQNAFLTILLMYPIIMLALFGSILGAKIILTVNYTTDWLAFVVALLTLAAGPVVIIATPKLAGALLSRFTGFINNPSKGGIDRLKNLNQAWQTNRQDEAASAYNPSQGNRVQRLKQRLRSGYRRTGKGRAFNDLIVAQRGDKWEGEQLATAQAALSQQGITNNRDRLKEVFLNKGNNIFMRTAAAKAIADANGTDELYRVLNDAEDGFETDAETRKIAAKAAVGSQTIRQTGTALADQSQAYIESLANSGIDFKALENGSAEDKRKARAESERLWEEAGASASDKVMQKIGPEYLANQKASETNYKNIIDRADQKHGAGAGKKAMLESLQAGLSNPNTRSRMNNNMQKAVYEAVAGARNTDGSLRKDASNNTIIEPSRVSDEQNIALLGVAGASVGNAIATHYASTASSLDTAKQDTLYAATSRAMQNNPGSREIATLHQTLDSIISSRPSGGGTP